MMATKRPRQDSNLRARLRRPPLYPLSYGGEASERTVASALVGLACAFLCDLTTISVAESHKNRC